MFFYKIKANLLNHDELEKEEQNSVVYALSQHSENIYTHYHKECYLFVYTQRKQSIMFGLIAKNTVRAGDILTEFTERAGLHIENPEIEVSTMKAIRNCLHRAYINDYVSAEDEILEYFGLSVFFHGYRHPEFDEELLNCKESLTKLKKKAANILCEDTLYPELERIFSGSVKVTGHPVHYMIENNNANIKKEMTSILLTALLKKKRIINNRFCTISFRGNSELPSEEFWDAFYRANIGGAVVLCFDANESNAGDSDMSSDRYPEMMAALCERMLRYKNDVLTLFCFPAIGGKIRSLLFENLKNCSVVELKEQAADYERANVFLQLRAKERGIRKWANFDSILTDKAGVYYVSDLEKAFDEWFSKKLKDTYYPQYSQFARVDSKVAASKPKDSAYSKLQEMIGLTEAKKVIRQALNYYKAQKLFEQKGMTADRPAMHMVFSGNPGTAKTTVARLFARIMKENGLLSQGDLVEVGRADLVGRYVGWTAQIVKQKFKAAKGSVLFIDEAFSLVDDKSNLFGDEAINTIVQEMENNREDTVVIFAGYPDKMEEFLNRNPGLRSRIAFHVPFSDYNAEELYEIGCLIARSKNMTIDAGAKEKVMPILESVKNQLDFGNGRFVRNFIERARMKQADRLLQMDPDAVTAETISVLTADDFDPPEIQTTPKRIRIGF